ncbi:autotransporter outer membrane beta-barrel domain-containing protein [Microbulbifer hydrolyticus]|uniref:Autotransporter outer membrane beta-barrel domain-containing protein n=1 Tax=Microbulbifer hydrolyticus TaxID=48074 RepID=A0A6P1TET4_9GAMM|nr:autotransporter outer membrane beta-barrel domain-containing protein [Microbulbifer hydrolyticus]MBB5212995.1 outer membrane autotransporter protein [Microbulbifer hydrolyticus]QHQ40361.1 autotransporter outer membrane beta-barrel domain-containing protein [Microbulbifer hydrolyticus]
MWYPRAGRAFDAGASRLCALALPALLSSLAPTGAFAQVALGSSDDHFTLSSGSPTGRSLDANLGTTLDGGGGNDTLVIQGLSLENPSRLRHWETISLEQATRLTLDTNLTLGDAGHLPGRLEVDSESSLLLPHYSAGIITSGGQALTLVNRGTIDMRGRTANQLLLRGDYIGHTGSAMYLDLVAGGDDSLADRVIIDGGHASGSTQLYFNRLAGSGASTADGILVVEARNGGSTSSGAFYMPQSISAGPYEYYLFRGNGDSQDDNNWYLRSTLQPGDRPAIRPDSGAHPIDSQSIAAFTSTESAPSVITDADTDTEGAATLLAPAPAAGNTPVPIYRPEIPLYAQAKSLARLTSLQEIGSYHKRRGEQRSWFDGINDDWMRVHHMRADYNWSGDISNRFDGSITGVQVGTNLWSGPTCTGGARESGIFVGSTRASGDVSGFARGFSDYSSGQNQLTSYHVGYYFNDYRPDMGYFDITAKVAYLKLESRSSRGIGDTITGPQLTVSVEKGITWQASERINIEPQLQAVVNYSNLSAYYDDISWVEPDMTPEANFRAGLRAYNTDGRWLDGNLRMYLFGNVWHTLSGNDQLLFDLNVQLNLERQATWGEFGGGVVLLEHKFGSAFLNLGYQRSLDKLNWSGGNASLGFNWAW